MTFTEFFNEGLNFALNGNKSDAKHLFFKALKLNPNSVETLFNLGCIFDANYDFIKANLFYSKAIKINPRFIQPYINLAVNKMLIGDYKFALKLYAKAIKIDKNHSNLLGDYFFGRLKTCDWKNFHKYVEQLGRASFHPFIALNIYDDERKIQALTHNFFLKTYGEYAERKTKFVTVMSKKIRIGYFSADFYDHATCYLLSDVLSNHNSKEFEIFVYSFGPIKKDFYRKRVQECVDHFFDVGHLSDQGIADLARLHGINIAVDLKGFTQDSRPGIFINGAAPIQVNYLGYPGTTANPLVDYIIADRTVVTEKNREFYSEKIVFLPNTYQPNSKRKVSEHLFSREDVGLPKRGFIFCCFNNTQKIHPDIFDRWMNILKQIPESVLWLLEDNQLASQNLLKEAKCRNVSSDRIIFAPRINYQDHLSRLRLADLFLDTYPYNAHTTCSDALWVGLPVLTCQGNSFASRVAASLLLAVNISELITHNLDDYEKKAVEVATIPEKIKTLRDQLILVKPKSPLFDTSEYTKKLELSYKKMIELALNNSSEDIFISA